MGSWAFQSNVIGTYPWAVALQFYCLSTHFSSYINCEVVNSKL